MTDFNDLRRKLIIGKNQAVHGTDKFHDGQFYENLSSKIFSSEQRPSLNKLAVTRDSLNPLLSHKTLMARLADIEALKHVRGVELTYWPHYFLTNTARHLLKYKFNYAVKGVAAYVVYRDIANYQHLKQHRFLSYTAEADCAKQVILHGAVFAGLCALI